MMMTIITFLLVEWWQDAVVPTHFEIDLLLNTFGNCPLGYYDAHTRLNGAQNPAVRVEDASRRSDDSVHVVIIVILQSAGAEEEKGGGGV